MQAEMTQLKKVLSLLTRITDKHARHPDSLRWRQEGQPVSLVRLVSARLSKRSPQKFRFGNFWEILSVFSL